MNADARLNPTDEMLFGASAKLGSARIIQVLWRLATEVPADAIVAAWQRLNTSRLSRRPVPATVPGARRRWVATHNEEPPRIYAAPLTESTLPAWLDEQVRAPLPADSDLLWRLAAAPYAGGTLVSLTVPHFRADGLGVFGAMDEPQDPRPAGFLDSDLGDALDQVSRAIAETVRWASNLFGDEAERDRLRTALRPAAPTQPGSEPRFFSTAVFDLDATEWARRAEAFGGTTNSLFVEIAANLVRARAARDDLNVGIPMSLRESAADDRANALVVVPLALPGGDPQHTELRTTRDATKALLAGSGAHSGTLVPEPLWHLLPAQYADRLKAPGAQQTDVVASNFGTPSDAVVNLFGQPADSVALRTMNVPGLVPERARLRASLCLVRVGERLTVTVTGLPDQFGDAAALRELVLDEFAAWGLTARRWPGTPTKDD